MKAAEWKRLVRPVLPAGQAWEFRGSLCYRRPLEWMLEGVLGEGSGFDRGVYVWQVVMPLFVPSTVVDLSWSERVGGPANKFGADETAAAAAAVRAAVEDTMDDPLERMASTVVKSNRAVNEARGYALLLQGSRDKAIDVLADAASGAVEARWEEEILGRVLHMTRLVLNDDHDAVLRQLGQWRDQTCGALGLKR